MAEQQDTIDWQEPLAVHSFEDLKRLYGLKHPAVLQIIRLVERKEMPVEKALCFLAAYLVNENKYLESLIKEMRMNVAAPVRIFTPDSPHTDSDANRRQGLD